MPAFPLVAPPRAIPFSVALRVRMGGVVNTIGWCVLGTGLAVAGALVGNSELATASTFDAPLIRVEGHVVDSRATGHEVNGQRIIEVEFEYQVGDRTCRGTSWTRQQPPQQGAVVTVECLRSDPTTARIQGMGSAPLPAIVALTLLFPLVGVVLLLVGAWRGGTRVRLLREGGLVMGRLIHRQATGTKINNQTVHRLTFAFTDAANQHRKVVIRSHRLDLLDTGATQPLLHEPGTDHAIAWHALPGRPTTDRDGLLQPVGMVGLLPVLLPPTVIAIVLSLLSPAL